MAEIATTGLRDLVGFIFGAMVVKDHASARAYEELHRSRADSLRASGDEGDLALQRELGFCRHHGKTLAHGLPRMTSVDPAFAAILAAGRSPGQPAGGRRYSLPLPEIMR